MTEKKVLSLVGHWQEFLGLTHWEISVDFSEPASEGDEANVKWSGDYDTATIVFDPGWPSWSQERANEIVVHELIHLMGRDLRMAWLGVSAHVEENVWTALSDRYDHELEGVIDRLSRKFVELAYS